MVIPHTALDNETLDRVIESFVLREGTDYGHQDFTMQDKIAKVRQQLKRGEACLTWDAELESCNIVSASKITKSDTVT
ncbi:MAG: hypothetical protein ACI8RZ_004922 [Myxococcota bacterium]|jgi:uncharacterized protein YheU (UPF0270 family)